MMFFLGHRTKAPWRMIGGNGQNKDKDNKGGESFGDASTYIKGMMMQVNDPPISGDWTTKEVLAYQSIHISPLGASRSGAAPWRKIGCFFWKKIKAEVAQW